MKIAVIAHAHFPIKQPFVGGLEAHTHQLISELSRQGHTVTLFAKAGTEADARLVTIFRGNAMGGENPLYIRGFERAMRMISRGNYDLIINNTLNYIPLKVHSAAMPPMVTIFHTPPFPNLVNVLGEQLSMSNRAYITVSEFTAMQWQPYCPDRIHVVSNGMDLSAWKANLQNHDTVAAAWAGRITPEKGTHLAIQACIEAGVPLKIGGPASDQNYFNSQVKPLLKNPLITYVGHLGHKGINDLFAEASVALVTPLWDEPFGLVAIEAWASGTPVAALPNGALPSLINPTVGSLAKSNSVTDLVTAMQQAAKVKRSVCRQYADDNFSLGAMVDSYLTLMPQAALDEAPSMLWQTAL